MQHFLYKDLFKVQRPAQANFWENSIYFVEILGIFYFRKLLKSILFQLEWIFIAEKRIHT